MVADRIVDEIDDGRALKLLHNVMSVCFCRLNADAKDIRHVLIALAFGEELHDFALTRRQKCVSARSFLMSRSQKFAEHKRRHRRGKEQFSE